MTAFHSNMTIFPFTSGEGRFFMKRYILPLLLTAFLFATQARGDATTVEVITLKHRTVEEVIPVLRPFVGSDGAISGMNNQLIVRARPIRLERIKEILARIDTAPRQLLITVAQNVSRKQVEREMAVSGSVKIGDNTGVKINEDGSGGTGAIEYRRGEDTVKGRGQSFTAIGQSGDTQKLRVLEGSQAFIRIGTLVPLPERTIVRNPNGVTVIGSSQYHDVTSGFYVLPRIAGDRVILEVSPQRATIGKQRSIDYQTASTRVSGRLGEWIEIGGIEHSKNGKDSKIWAGRKSGGSENRGIFLKVEEVK